jgi:hypothetical protein
MDHVADCRFQFLRGDLALIDEGNLARADVGDVLGGLRRPQASSISKRRENFASAFFLDLALMPAQRSEVFAPSIILKYGLS